MRKRGKWVLLALTPLLVGGLIAGEASAFKGRGYGYTKPAHWRTGYGRPGWAYGNRLAWMKEELQLTDEQVQRVRDVVLEGGKRVIKDRADLRVSGLELRELLAKAEVDKSAVDEKVKQIGQLRQKLLQDRIDTHLKIREILTPEQREKAGSLFMGRFLSSHPARFYGKKWGAGRRGPM